MKKHNWFKGFLCLLGFCSLLACSGPSPNATLLVNNGKYKYTIEYCMGTVCHTYRTNNEVSTGPGYVIYTNEYGKRVTFYGTISVTEE